MPEEIPRTLNHFALFAVKDAYEPLPPAARAALHRNWLAGPLDAALAVQLYPCAENGLDLPVCSAVALGGPDTTARFFECQARANDVVRPCLVPVHSLWCYTRPSPHTKARSAQEIDIFNLGYAVLPETPGGHVKAVVKMLQELFVREVA